VKLVTFVFILVLFTQLLSADGLFTYEERLQGFKINDDTTFFIFDETIYNQDPNRVVVEGEFRDWNHDMEDASWWLKKSDKNKSIWILKTTQILARGGDFKFRINNGKWLNPPDDAPNKRGNNLVFGTIPNIIKLKAELVGPKHIRGEYSGREIDISYNPESYRLFNASGVEVPILKVLYIRPAEIQVLPVDALDPYRIYYLQDKKNNLKSVCRYDGWFRHTYSDKKLGAFYDKKLKKTWFRIFAPRATSVRLYLYKNPEASSYKQHTLAIDRDGVWELSIPGDLTGVYYDYTIHGSSDPGNHFFETNPVHISDPYCMVSVDSWGPGRVWPEVDPPRPLKNGIPAIENVVAYEVHVQDFTRNLPVSAKKQNTFTAFIERGLTNSNGEKIGFDHLVDLGINVVHLQPVQEFIHFPDKAWQDAFLNVPYMIDQGVNMENYQWGYRTSHAMAIESRFREKGSDWGDQNTQFRDLVQAFHDEDIAVIVDVVFNHTAERMDGRMDYFNFSAMDKQYYYRTDKNLDFIGEYGTETKSEERPMVQRWIIDQCTNLVDQYGVDGFRIDLAGQTDKQTLRELRRILGPDIIVYGEPWIASADPDYENNPDWDWYKVDSPITFFQDDARNAFKGSPDNPRNKWRDRGFAGGNGDRENVKKALCAGFDTDKTPVSGINYLDIHDNWALADRYAISDWDGRKGVEESRVKIAATLLFTSLGPVVIHGGTEFLRSKAHAPLEELKMKFEDGFLAFHGKRDTYNLAKANEFLWENKGKSLGDDNGNIKCNYNNMYEYWKGLIQLRLGSAGKVFRISSKPKNDYYQWIEPKNSHLLGYIADNTIFVLMNTDTVSGTFENVDLPSGQSWRLVGTIDRIDVSTGIRDNKYSEIQGGQKLNITLDKESVLIWVKR